MNTRNKRASVIGLALPFMGRLPLADSSINLGDRQSLAWRYAYGSSTSLAATVTGGAEQVVTEIAGMCYTMPFLQVTRGPLAIDREDV